MESFREWLKNEKGLSQRSTNDVVSRLRRVSSILDPLKTASAEELTFLLSQNVDFKALTMTVRSQLKRSANLFREFKQIKDCAR